MTHEDISRRLWNEFERRSRGLGNRIAVSSPEGDVSFAVLYDAAETLADRLLGIGVKEGDTIGLSISNRQEFIIAWLALCRLSATVALISPKYHESELLPILKTIQPGHILTIDGATDFSAGGILPCRKERLACGLTGASLTVSVMGETVPSTMIDQAPSKPALIKFTSGSTGVPKGIALSAENALAEAANVVDTLSITPEDRILVPTPLSHSYGFDLAVLPLLYAGARIILRGQFIPRQVMNDLQSGVSVFLGVPSMYRFLNETRFSVVPDLSRVRYLLSCTAPLNPDTIETFYRKFGVVICQHYGSSETGAATTHVPGEVLRRPASVGRAMRGVRISIVDSDGQTVPAGQTGEVVVSSRAVAQGYVLGNPDGRSPIQNGTYHTGDLGYLDDDGFLHLEGRKDQLINVGGYKVATEEVVRVLESCPAVREAAVIGAKDQSGEEVVYAVVTLQVPAGENEILRFCRGRLAEYKVPRRIDIRREMPRLPSGKIHLQPEDIVW